uniref:Uncharacterized protein n=1 Tax=Aegilops tauschii subsp. strangulata TaxID=200361 RepID=A0A453Q496_AEGTS
MKHNHSESCEVAHLKDVLSLLLLLSSFGTSIISLDRALMCHIREMHC